MYVPRLNTRKVKGYGNVCTHISHFFDKRNYINTQVRYSKTLKGKNKLYGIISHGKLSYMVIWNHQKGIITTYTQIKNKIDNLSQCLVPIRIINYVTSGDYL